MSHRRMTDPSFRQWQKNHMRDPHVAEINAFVDTLATRKGTFVPHVSPEFGGRNARVLFLLFSPGARTNDQHGARGSGFLSVQNDDPAASRIAEAMGEADLPVEECIGWNSYPWYVEAASDQSAEERRRQIEEGSLLLIDLIAMLPELRSVLVFGEWPKTAWRLFGGHFPRTRRSLDVHYHRSTGPRGYIGSNAEQFEWQSQLIDTMVEIRNSIVGPNRLGPPAS